jgi:glycosyltransferase involved in cell wall biosynthesis
MARFPSVHLVLFGTGPLQEELRRQAEQAGISGHLHFPGFRKDLPRLLGGFQVVLQPSLSEGLSVSILEAMGAGRPIVACDIQGNRELIRHGKNGLLVPPADPAALAAAVIQMLSDPARAAIMGQQAAHECRTRFSEQRMVEQTITIYDRVCRRMASNAIEPELARELPDSFAETAN